MYFNNVFIGYYVIIALIGLIVGKLIAWCNIRIPENKKIFSKEFFEINKEGIKANYIFMLIISIFYIALLYRFGIKKEEISKNMELLKFLILIPMLILAFAIDFEYRIIPNRLNLTIFEFGLILTFIFGIINVNMAKDYILGMIVGTIIFVFITILGRIISGKEAMGLGDVKFIGALGLYFGVNSIAEISLLSFFIAAVGSILILLVRFFILRKKDEYIPFGPFISISAILCIFLPASTVFNTFLAFCQAISEKIII